MLDGGVGRLSDRVKGRDVMASQWAAQRASERLRNEPGYNGPMGWLANLGWLGSVGISEGVSAHLGAAHRGQGKWVGASALGGMVSARLGHVQGVTTHKAA